jgi:hypothetical protein
MSSTFKKEFETTNGATRRSLFAIGVVFLFIGIALGGGAFMLNGIYKIENVYATRLEIALHLQNTANNAINYLGSIGLLYILIGAFGIKSSIANEKKPFLIILSLLLALAFLIQISSLIIVYFKASFVEQSFQKSLKYNMNKINYRESSMNAYERNYYIQSVYIVTEMFMCCGEYNGPDDFRSKEDAEIACMTLYTKGCATAVPNMLQLYGFIFFILPTIIMLLAELISIIMVGIFISKTKVDQTKYKQLTVE